MTYSPIHTCRYVYVQIYSLQVVYTLNGVIILLKDLPTTFYQSQRHPSMQIDLGFCQVSLRLETLTEKISISEILFSMRGRMTNQWIDSLFEQINRNLHKVPRSIHDENPMPISLSNLDILPVALRVFKAVGGTFGVRGLKYGRFYTFNQYGVFADFQSPMWWTMMQT